MALDLYTADSIGKADGGQRSGPERLWDENAERHSAYARAAKLVDCIGSNAPRNEGSSALPRRVPTFWPRHHHHPVARARLSEFEARQVQDFLDVQSFGISEQMRRFENMDQ